MSRRRAAGLFAGAAVLLVVAHATGASDATAIDGDTIALNGTRIRLDGIDAPELAQTCRTAPGAPWACGIAARDALADILAGATLRCDVTGRDRYGRPLAICFAGTADIGAALVEQGLALAYRRYSVRYVPNEDRARAAARGLWRGTFDPPWDWRSRTPNRP